MFTHYDSSIFEAILDGKRYLIRSDGVLGARDELVCHLFNNRNDHEPLDFFIDKVSKIEFKCVLAYNGLSVVEMKG